MNIKILSNKTINRIAAGEVVERPASAVKELVENSIDAKASKIDVVIENAGRNLIAIIDDGIGMNKDDLSLAVERHTTSKLPDEDINNIEFFGFRGEALPSIASVSRMSITSISSSNTQEHAWKISVIGGKKEEPQPASLSKGTKIEVRDLFFATPARLKFLKTEKTEIHYIEDSLTRIAMANPEVGFSLTSDSREIFNYPAQKGDEALYNRLNNIVKKGFNENFTYIELNEDECKIQGFISLPTYNCGTSNEQYFFINRRPVKDKLLSMAVKIAYQDFIPHGRYPVVYLFLEIDSGYVDVNVHPAKAEVRFKDSTLVRNIVISAIKRGIRDIGNQASEHLTPIAVNSFVPEKILDMNEVSKLQFTSAPKINFTRPSVQEIQKSSSIFAPIAPVVKAQPEQFDSSQIQFPLGAACGQIHDTYIISQTNEGMILIDQHAAHERIFYEKLKQEVLAQNLKTQRLLIPEIIELPSHVIEQLMEQSQEFIKFGLHIEQFGNGAISVTELPALLKCSNVRKLILDIVDDLSEYNKQISLEKKIQHYLATFACHHSIRAGRNLSIKEMNDLLREMERYPHTGQCNHGRPTYIKLDLKDIEKLFERS
jgi:DNA mismatch repair protein MutL